MGSIHLIRIPERDDRKRAMQAFLDVREAWMGFPDNVFGVCSDHVEALKKCHIPFEDASYSKKNGQTSVQS